MPMSKSPCKPASCALVRIPAGVKPTHHALISRQDDGGSDVLPMNLNVGQCVSPALSSAGNPPGRAGETHCPTLTPARPRYRASLLLINRLLLPEVANAVAQVRGPLKLLLLNGPAQLMFQLLQLRQGPVLPDLGLQLPQGHHRPLSLKLERIVLERSEEHTSELQSLRHLVCRLL